MQRTTNLVCLYLRTLAMLIGLVLGTITLTAQESDSTAGSRFSGPMRLEAGEEGEAESGDQEKNEEPDVFQGLLERMSGSWVQEFNRFGSFNYLFNGLGANVETDHYKVNAAYGYLNEGGYRTHSEQYRNRFSFGVETTPTKNTRLRLLGRYSAGRLKMPGSLTITEYDDDPYQADPRSVNRDEKCISSDGDVAVIFNAGFGRNLGQEIEIKAYGGLEYMERATREYMVVNSHELGLDAHYVWRAAWGRRHNVLVAGGDLLGQPERTEYYDNMGGTRGDLVEQIVEESSSRAGINLLDTFEILPEKFFFQFRGRYEYTEYSVSEMTLPSRSDKRVYSAFIPNLGLEYKVLEWLDLFGSAGLLYESPAFRQMESPDPFYLYNPDLMPQRSKVVLLGLKAEKQRNKDARSFKEMNAGITLTQGWLDDIIVPYEVYGDIFYRNASSGKRFGVRFDGMANIVGGLGLDVSYTYSLCEYGTYNTLSTEEDPAGNVVQVQRDFSGNKEPGFPGHDVRIALAYDQSVTRIVRVTAKVGYTGLGGFWVDDLNSAETDFYSVVDALAGVDLQFGHLKVAVAAGVNNIFDCTFVAYPTLNSANYRFYNAGEPRNFVVNFNLGYSF